MGGPKVHHTLPMGSKKVSPAQFRGFCLEGDIAGARRFRGCVDARELKGKYGDTGLLLALRAGEDDLAKVLIEEMGADVSRRSRTGDSPLSVVVELRDVEMVEYLLEKGADPSQPNALNAAIPWEAGRPIDESDEVWASVGVIVRLLVDHGAVYHCPQFGSGGEVYSTFSRAAPALWPVLIRAGADPNASQSIYHNPPDWREMTGGESVGRLV